MTNPDDNRKSLRDLLAVMAALRTPGSGCPWDLEQTFETIAPYTLEEAYEVADAIVRGDLVDLEEELGDLLLQVVYHAQIAEEAGAFTFEDVADGITRKMIRRHPHVFGSKEERAAGAGPGFWARIKVEEKAAKAAERAAAGHAGEAVTNPSLLDDIPAAMPALMRAVKLQERAAKVGFDWPSLAPVFDKIREEVTELEEVALRSDRPEGGGEAVADKARIEEEFGDLLFVMANLARHLRLDPEGALRAANDKFRRRFGYIEARLGEQGRTPADSDLQEMDALWDEAKRSEQD
ncbi:MAG: nucleoside triphosphate hydrolase [Alphaproteobacteria bacterium BRH_c36]|nr:MAG: nucleoside triphosphate hydrolase [Alphaproteobacteria bacterium BRH_c36]